MTPIDPTAIFPGLTLADITKRETEVLALMCQGLTYQEIGDRLGTSPRTVECQLSTLVRKLRVPNRVAAAVWACKQGLV